MYRYYMLYNTFERNLSTKNKEPMHISSILSEFQRIADKCQQLGPLQSHNNQARLAAIFCCADVPVGLAKLVWPAPRIGISHPWIDQLKDVAGTRVLVGPPRSGKSLAAAHVVASRARAELYSRWALAPSVAPSGEWLPVWRELERTDFLVIDGFGQEHKNATQRLDSLICARHDNDLPTLICTGIAGEEFRERTSSRLRRRIAESGPFIACKWEAK